MKSQSLKLAGTCFLLELNAAGAVPDLLNDKQLFLNHFILNIHIIDGALSLAARAPLRSVVLGELSTTEHGNVAIGSILIRNRKTSKAVYIALTRLRSDTSVGRGHQDGLRMNANKCNNANYCHIPICTHLHVTGQIIEFGLRSDHGIAMNSVFFASLCNVIASVRISERYLSWPRCDEMLTTASAVVNCLIREIFNLQTI